MGLFRKKQNQNAGFAFSQGERKRTLHKHLEFTATEQYKLLRTNLAYTIPQDVKCPIIGVTSSTRGEGKSTTAVNLSYVLAENKKRVLLIDGDLRIPSIAKKMEIDHYPGLTDMLMGRWPASLEELRSSLLEDWYILPSGAIPPNPSELIGSSRMEVLLRELSEKFDYIVIDLPPLNIVSDALAVAKLITGMIVVVREDYTEKKELENCFRQLGLSNINVLGCVMNECKVGKFSYGKYRKKSYYQSNP